MLVWGGSRAKLSCWNGKNGIVALDYCYYYFICLPKKRSGGFIWLGDNQQVNLKKKKNKNIFFPYSSCFYWISSGGSWVLWSQGFAGRGEIVIFNSLWHFKGGFHPPGAPCSVLVGCRSAGLWAFLRMEMSINLRSRN